MLTFADTARPVPLDQLPDLLQLLLPHLPIARASWIVTQLTNRVEAGQSHRIRPYELRDGDDFLLGAVLLDQPASSASLLAIHGPLATQASYAQRSQPLMDLIRRQLAGANIRFVQTCVDGEVDAQRLGQLGFEEIAKLALMVFEVPERPNGGEPDECHRSEVKSPEDLVSEPTFHPVAHDPALVARLCRLAEDSFESTFDCPRLARFRSPQDITAGFCLSDSASPDHWRLVRSTKRTRDAFFDTPPSKRHERQPQQRRNCRH